MAQKLTDDKKEILQDLDGDDLPPPLYWMMTRPPPNAPPGPEATLMPDLGPGEAPAAAAAPLSTLLEIVEPPFWQPPVPAMVTSGQCPQNSASARPSRLYPHLPVSTDGTGEENTAIRQRLHSAKEQGEEPHYRCPSESYKSLQFRTQGNYHQPPVAYYFQPFSSTDILNWQRHTPPHSGEPQALIRLMETIFQTHRPTWDDIIQLPVSLFSTEERYRILRPENG